MNPEIRPAPTSMQLGAVLLAAGAARRMGGRPKCLLELDGEPLIRRLLSALGGAGIPNPVVVLGHHARRIAASLEDMEYTPTFNPDPDAGTGSSVQLGLQALPAEVDAVMVLLADQPLITAQDVRDLVAAYQARPPGVEWVQPSVAGLPGNPVIFSAGVRDQWLAGPPGLDGKEWKNRLPQAVWDWDTDNVHYRADVDSPQDIQALGAQTGHCLRWPDDLAAQT